MNHLILHDFLILALIMCSRMLYLQLL